MKTVAITINKGGVGKTMLSKSLATAASAAGFNALVLDMDSQQNSTAWGKRRTQEPGRALPLVRFTTEKDLEDELHRADIAGCDLSFVDTPPGRSGEALAASEVALQARTIDANRHWRFLLDGWLRNKAVNPGGTA